MKKTEIRGISIPEGARAVLVFRDHITGELQSSPVAHEQALLNIERDLLKHLNERAHTEEWLEALRDYCDARLRARRDAKARRSFITPSTRFDWDMTSIIAAQGGR